jgi:hypothetical protein
MASEDHPLLRALIATVSLLVLPFPAAHAFEFPIDHTGYGQHLRELCLIKARVAMPDTEFVASARFCSLYIETPLVSAPSCTDTPETCTRRFLSDYFNVRLSRPIENLTRCDDRGCKVYYNFRDAENRYESATECGFDIGGIAGVVEGKVVTMVVNVSINRNCLRDG